MLSGQYNSATPSFFKPHHRYNQSHLEQITPTKVTQTNHILGQLLPQNKKLLLRDCRDPLKNDYNVKDYKQRELLCENLTVNFTTVFNRHVT